MVRKTFLSSAQYWVSLQPFWSFYHNISGHTAFEQADHLLAQRLKVNEKNWGQNNLQENNKKTFNHDKSIKLLSLCPGNHY
jgi:hypothetical protein